MKAIVREVIARIPGLRFWVARRIFLGPGHNTHRFWGVFPTMAAAKAYAPKNFKQNFEAPDLENNINEKIHERDNEVVDILSRLLPESRTLFDLGGNVGMSFYQYRTRIPYPADFRWTVCGCALCEPKGPRDRRSAGRDPALLHRLPARS